MQYHGIIATVFLCCYRLMFVAIQCCWRHMCLVGLSAWTKANKVRQHCWQLHDLSTPQKQKQNYVHDLAHPFRWATAYKAITLGLIYNVLSSYLGLSCLDTINFLFRQLEMITSHVKDYSRMFHQNLQQLNKNIFHKTAILNSHVLNKLGSNLQMNKARTNIQSVLNSHISSIS